MIDPGDEWARRVLAPLRDIEIPALPSRGGRLRSHPLRLAVATLIAAVFTVSITLAAQRGIFTEIERASVAPAARDYDVIAVFTSGPGEDQDIGYLDTSSGTIEPLVVADGDQSDPALSPDGTVVFYTSTGRDGETSIESVSMRDGARSKIFSRAGVILGAPTPAPTGTRLLVSASARGAASDSVDLWVMDLDGSQPSRIELDRVVLGGPYLPRWSPDGEHLLAGVRTDQDESRIVPVVISLFGHLTVLQDLPEMAPAIQAAWDPDGEGFAYVALDGGVSETMESVVFVDLQGEASWRISLPEGREITQIRFSQDGEMLAAISDWLAPESKCSDEGYTYPCRHDGLIVLPVRPDAEPTALARGPGMYGPMWSANGESIIYWRMSEPGAELVAVDQEGKETELIGSWASNPAEDEGSMQLADSLIRPVSGTAASLTAD